MEPMNRWTIELPTIEPHCIPDGSRRECIRLDEIVTAIPVDSSSAGPLRDAVSHIEALFRRECSLQDVELRPRGWMEAMGGEESWLYVASPGHPRDADDRRLTAIGALSIYTVSNDRWELAWAWVHPWERDRHVLSSLWPYLAGRYGSFHVPYLRALTPFLLDTERPYVGKTGVVYLRGR
jgi:hypothetical protein